MVGSPTLHVAQKVGVIDDAGEVSVLVVDADGEEMPAIANSPSRGMRCDPFIGKLISAAGSLSSDSGHAVLDRPSGARR